MFFPERRGAMHNHGRIRSSHVWRTRHAGEWHGIRALPVFAALALLCGAPPLAALSDEEPTQLYGCLVRRAREISSTALGELPSREVWYNQLEKKRQQWREMLGLEPLPPRTELHVTKTGTLKRETYVVEKMHFQPLPGCRIAANLYLPKEIKGPLPAVVYVCGHSAKGKFNPPYQLQARWFAEHGYVAMILDAIQIGENRGFHHGTHKMKWWHWHSQGYSPASVEVWAAMRAADYLQSRPEVDPERLGITGNSGGGTVSWFTGAADPRFKVVAPSCQTGNMYQHVRDRTIDGHCDCSFWINTYGWDFTDLAGLIAPRALLVAAATEDRLFRPYAFRDLVHRARKLYILLGCEERIDLTEAVTKHGYSPKTRLAVFNWFERHLKGSDLQITEDIADTPDTEEELAVYPNMKPPADDRLKDADTLMIPLPEPPPLSDRAVWEEHQGKALAQLRAMSFRQIPHPLPTPSHTYRAQGQHTTLYNGTYEFHSEPGMLIRAQLVAPLDRSYPYALIIGAMQPEARTTFYNSGAGNQGFNVEVAGYACVEVRGTGGSSIGPGLEWSARRAYPLVGQTLFERKTLDFLCAVQILRTHPNASATVAYGRGEEAAIAIYAALLDPAISEIVLDNPVTTHWEGGPDFLNVLRVGDLPHNLALAFPRPITFIGSMPKEFEWTRKCYAACGLEQRVRVIKTQKQWSPTQE